jgi:NitT/TauT family transport system ATP-binding protein
MTADAITPIPDKATAAYIDFQNVSMTFPDGTHAVDDVSFEVRQGEFVTVVGPSGCGKSTLLRIASGLTKQTGGTVIGNPREMGYVFQDATLLQWRTVQRNIDLFAELESMPKKERQQRVAENIELVGLSGHEEKYPKQLSGGMKMRVSLARSLVMEPSMFLFDEPFGALDEITREFLNDELLSLFKSKQFGSLFITHSIYEAVFLSTRVLVMSARPGRIVASFDIPFPYPRTPDLRFGAEFGEIAGEVSHALRGAHE